jgi:hypothetical protein
MDIEQPRLPYEEGAASTIKLIQINAQSDRLDVRLRRETKHAFRRRQ